MPPCAQLLDTTDDDLAGLPERFTAARQADARALVALDHAVYDRYSASPSLRPTVVAAKLAVAARMVGNKLLGDAWVAKPAFIRLMQGGAPYTQLLHDMRRDELVVSTTAALAAAAAVAAAALLLLRGQR